MYSTSQIYLQGSKPVYTRRLTGHAPYVRWARRNGPVLILKGVAAQINAGLYERIGHANA